MIGKSKDSLKSRTPTRILIMGLSGSGKTTFAKKLVNLFATNCYYVTWFNADDVREITNNWDFSHEGRVAQWKLLNHLSQITEDHYTVTDFIAPTQESRDIFAADYIIWMNTVESSKYSDTDALFEPPKQVDYVISDRSDDHALNVYKQITNEERPILSSWNSSYCNARRERGRMEAKAFAASSR